MCTFYEINGQLLSKLIDTNDMTYFRLAISIAIEPAWERDTVEDAAACPQDQH